MSPTQSRSVVAVDDAERPLRQRRKAVLTCPRCTHESPPDGDWIWATCDDGMAICCPDCRELLTVRKQFDESDTPK